VTLAGAAAGSGGGPRRFIAPARADVPPTRFAHPLYADVAGYAEILQRPEWPAIAALDACLAGDGPRLVVQDAELLADGLHYEARIAEGRIATRPANWHDLFNSLIWARFPRIKHALNVQQCRHIATLPFGQRNRAQAALTQFDESGVIVRLSDPALLAAWDAHDWPQLFTPSHWQAGRIEIAAVFGHALLEQGLLPAKQLVGKCVVVQGAEVSVSLDAVAKAIASGQLLTDPLQLRPLPLGGIPGWHPPQQAPDFTDVDYFRLLRAGRHYPPPLLPGATRY